MKCEICFGVVPLLCISNQLSVTTRFGSKVEYRITPTPKPLLWAMLASVLGLNEAYLLGKSLEFILNQHEELKIITPAFMLRNGRV
jgi:hypothetical protein